MYVILWEYHVKAEKQAEFERFYSANGAWADLFKKSAGYLRTEFLRDETNPQRYLTIDRWNSEAEFRQFLIQRETEYKTLDAACAHLAEKELLLGKWSSV
jgi:heme-degrading monooxygenase HmoA